MTIPARHRLRPVRSEGVRGAILAGLALVLGGALSLSGCGEKIVVPEAEGIRTSSDYVEITPASLADELEGVSDVMNALDELFICERDRGRVVRITSDGRVNTFFGPPAEGLLEPVALAAAEEQRLIFVGEQNAGVPSIAILSFLDLSLELRVDVSVDGVQSISGLAVVGQHLLVSDPVGQRIHRYEIAGGQSLGITPMGEVATGDSGNKESPQSVFEPTGLAVDLDGRMLVCDADTTRNWVLRFDVAPPDGDPEGPGRAVPFDQNVCADGNPSLDSFTLGIAPACGEQFFVGGPSTEAGGFHAPSGAAVDAEGRIYVADRMNGRVQRFSSDGVYEFLFGELPGTDRGLQEPTRVATWLGERVVSGTRISIAGARIFVVDAGTGSLRVFEDLRWTQANDTGN